MLAWSQEVRQINQDPESVDTKRGSALRIAVSSSSAGPHPGWVWGLSLLVVVVGGVTLYAARVAMATALDHWLPKLQPTVTASDEPEILTAAEPDAEEVVEPEWAFVDIEAAIRPLPDNTLALIAEGRDELSDFSDLDSADQTRALLIRNRWRLWARIWLNRVEHVRGPMPPAAACDRHAALEPTCRAVRASLAMLDRLPAAGSVGEAGELLDQASQTLEDLRQSQTEPEEDSAPPPSAVP